MALSIGIVGLPNVGKSTLFNAMLKSELAEAANFAFTTIDPNVGIVEVPDERLEKLAEIEKSGRIVPATVKFIDIAGIIAGAHKGEGLGNKFLAHIREVDAIAMVVRTFENKDVIHVAGDFDPKNDIETIMTELVLADMETLEKRISAVEKEARAGEKFASTKLAAYKKVQAKFENSRPAIEADLSDEEKELLKEANFLTLKPFLYIFNVSENKVGEDPADLIEEYGLNELVEKKQATVISARIESELNSLSDLDREEYLSELGLEEPGLNRLIKSAYKTLGLVSFFTAGEMEARAWTIKNGDKAPAAAGKIHNDFEKKFIKAEVVAYDDFVHPVRDNVGDSSTAKKGTEISNGARLGGWKGAKEQGKMRLEGKDYAVKEADVLFIHHG
ncbi:MAG: redox-regulated ATPase YchF [Candidatus Berkelbacteria bacterium]|nr:redox-regulated ATPase YchF [Candidatus Berkelbacteria bacterium]